MEGCCVTSTAERGVTMQALRGITRNAVRRSSHPSGAALARMQSLKTGSHQSVSLPLSRAWAATPLANEGSPLLKSASTAAYAQERLFAAPICKPKTRFPMVNLRNSFLDSCSSVLARTGSQSLSPQNSSRCLSTGPTFRVSATADVREEARPEELGRENRRPLPPRPLKDVWVRPGVTPPPDAQDFDEAPPRKSFARPPKSSRDNERYKSRPRYERNFSRGGDSWWDGPPEEDDKRAAESDKPKKEVVKKKVALWLGYVGTDFKGSMMQRGQPGPTVEGVLEEAIFKAGGMKESNFGDFKKIGWNRSSRTDKGVHALASVVSFKMEVPAEVFAHDPDGLSIADRINEHLPPIIRVYGVQPVTKSFNAYHNCRARTYEYVLPAPIIGITDDMDDVAAQQALDQLRTILQKYEGRQPFHNFTVRRLYRPGKKGSKRKVTRLTQESETLLDLEGGGDDPLSVLPSKISDNDASASHTTADSDAGSLGVEEGAQNSEVGSSRSRAVSDRSGLHADTSEDAEKFSDAVGGRLDAASNHPDAAGDELGRDSDAYGYADDDADAYKRSDSEANADERWNDVSDAFGRGDDGDPSDYLPSATDKFFAERRESEELELAYDEEEEDDEGNWVERRGPTAQWLLDTPPEDRIGPSHYRRILAATCTGLEPLGKSRVVRIHFEGESFMLHQIRKMVGAAVAIMRGDFPLALLDATLACHSRVIVPMAPAEGLFLSRTRFFPFRTSFNRDFASDGPALEMTPPMEEAREEFRRTELLPAMAPLLDAERDPWTTWVKWLETLGPVPQEEVTEVLSCFEEWRSHQPERGTETRERPPWFQNSVRPRPTGPRSWASRGGAQSSGMGGRWGR